MVLEQNDRAKTTKSFELRIDEKSTPKQTWL